jgi:lysophospholipase L1-like esterase
MLIQPNQTILFEGDSLTSRNMPPANDTWPFLRLMGWHRTYADVMQEWLFAARPELGLKFRNSAVGGSSMGQVLGRFDAVVPVVKPDWVILTTGHNDATRQIPLAQFEQEIATYARRLREATGGRIAIVGGMVACPGAPADVVEYLAKIPPYQVAARAAVESTGGVYIHLAEGLVRKTKALSDQYAGHTVYSDGVHLNELGAQVVAALVLQALGLVRID